MKTKYLSLLLVVLLLSCNKNTTTSPSSNTSNNTSNISTSDPKMTYNWLLRKTERYYLGVANIPIISNDPINCHLNLMSTHNSTVAPQFDAVTGLNCIQVACGWKMNAIDILELSGNLFEVLKCTTDSLVL